MLADRPRKPEIVKGKVENYVFWFIPDNLKFGRWTSKTEAENALEAWTEYQNQPAINWQAYCRAVGIESVHFI